MAFWPAWIVAPVLAALGVGYWIVLRRPLAVSGVVARFSRLREELALDRTAAALRAERAAIAAAKAMARAEGLPLAVTGVPELDASLARTGEWRLPPPDVVVAPAGRVRAPTPAVAVHATFLVALAAGGLLASLARGSFGAGMGADFVARLGGGAGAAVALLAGGALVGFGAALCGGCAAGHGLTGCGRRMPGSFVATAVFLGAAVVTALLLRSLA
jgi:hypothetical protein